MAIFLFVELMFPVALTRQNIACAHDFGAPIGTVVDVFHDHPAGGGTVNDGKVAGALAHDQGHVKDGSVIALAEENQVPSLRVFEIDALAFIFLGT